MMEKKPKIALALGGGGARGMAHIGVIKALETAGLKFDVVVGTSIGSLLGACFSLGQTAAMLEAEALTLTKRKAINELLDFNLPHRSLLGGKKAHRYIKRLIGKADFENTKIPLLVVATNLADGQPVVLRRGDLASAIQASCSVPGIFPPVKIGEDYLVDGGVASPTPVQEAFAWGADIVVAVDLLISRGAKIIEKPNLLFTLLQSYEIIRNKSMWDDQNSAHKVIMIRPNFNSNSIVSSFKFFDIKESIESGYRATEALLPQILATIDNYKINK